MSNKRQEITARGIAQKSGLEVLSSLTTYNGEHINFGNAPAYATQLDSDPDYATDAADTLTDALINSPANHVNEWYRYHSYGSPYVEVSAPVSRRGTFIFYAQATASKPSYSGMYQKLSLTAGKEYEVSVQTYISPTFTASTANDIIILYFTTLSLSLVDATITTISIKEKQEYLVPIYATDKYGNAHKVLRITSNETLSDD